MVAPIPPHLPWDSLPSDLQNLVLAHLPFSEQSRLRSVSRSWLSILASSHVRDLHRRLHPRVHPSFLVYNHAVKISACTWPHVANEAATSPPSWIDLSLPAPFVREWVGAGSLICVRNHLTSNAFSVGCPHSNQWKTLPNPPQAPLLSKLWAMVPHTSAQSADTYHVLLLQLNSPSLYVDVYNSEKNFWTRTTVPKGAGKGNFVAFSSTATCVGGLLYSIQTQSRSVVTYDVQRDVWKTLEAKLPENLVFQAPYGGGLIQTSPQVIRGCKDKVLLVGAAAFAAPSDPIDKVKRCCDSDDSDSLAARPADDIAPDAKGSEDIDYGHGILNHAVVWELDRSCKEWREMARAPFQMCMHMIEEAMESRKASVMPVKYSGHAELIIIMAAGSQRALQFDAIEEKWAWLELPPAANSELSLCL